MAKTMLALLALPASLLFAAVNAQWPQPEPCTGSCNVHDPSIVRIPNGTYYRYGSAPNISLAYADHLSGPWTNVSGGALPTHGGPLLGAPDVTLYNGTYYMYHQHTVLHTLNSNMSIATSTDLLNWVKRGDLNIPYKPFYNRIDPNLLILNNGSEMYLSWGSYWKDIFSVKMNIPPLSADLSNIYHLEENDTTVDPRLEHPSEGSFQFAWTINATQYFYLFFSSGADGQDSLHVDLVSPGNEYKIMVCRATTPTGLFLDQNGLSCLDKGGTLIYGSNGTVYAPGGQGVMYDDSLARVVMYYHYIDRSLDIENAQFGWNYLNFTSDGWPIVVASVASVASAASAASRPLVSTLLAVGVPFVVCLVQL